MIVKRLAAIQNFGSMNVLCTDKTGTLTENRVKLALYVDINGEENNKVLLYSYINSYYQTGIKSPLGEAILRFKDINVKDYEKIDKIPFDSVRKRLSVVVKYEDQRLLITKGAPEEVIKISSFYESKDNISNLTNEVRKNIEKRYFELSAEGYRVLAVAYKLLREDKPRYTVNDEKEMVFLGFLAFIDPPKETAREALKLLRNSGIEVKILTGDNELVTRKVCEYLGFNIKKVVTGSEIADMSDDVLARVVEEANVFL